MSNEPYSPRLIIALILSVMICLAGRLVISQEVYLWVYWTGVLASAYFIFAHTKGFDVGSVLAIMLGPIVPVMIGLAWCSYKFFPRQE